MAIGDNKSIVQQHGIQALNRNIHWTHTETEIKVSYQQKHYTIDDLHRPESSRWTK